MSSTKVKPNDLTIRLEKLSGILPARRAGCRMKPFIFLFMASAPG